MAGKPALAAWLPLSSPALAAPGRQAGRAVEATPNRPDRPKPHRPSETEPVRLWLLSRHAAVAAAAALSRPNCSNRSACFDFVPASLRNRAALKLISASDICSRKTYSPACLLEG
jgi:hypothetical protein